MKTETIVVGAVIGGVALVALVAGGSKPAAAASGKDYPGPWTPGIFQSKIKVGDRLIVILPNPGTYKAFGVLYAGDLFTQSRGRDTLALTDSKASGPTKAIFTGKSVGGVDLVINLFDTSDPFGKPILLNGVLQSMVIHVEVTL